jgi:hypothetical protein
VDEVLIHYTGDTDENTNEDPSEVSKAEAAVQQGVMEAGGEQRDSDSSNSIDSWCSFGWWYCCITTSNSSGSRGKSRSSSSNGWGVTRHAPAVLSMAVFHVWGKGC